MADIKRELNLYSLYDHKGMVEHFKKMAARGWLLCGIGDWFFSYRRIEPSEVAFDIAYLAGRSSFVPDSDKSLADLTELTEKSGWEYAGSIEQLQVFYNLDPNAVPLYTEPSLQLESIHKSMMKGPVRSNIVFLIIVFINIAIRSGSFIEFATDAGLFILIVGWVIIGLVQIAELAAYFIWYRKALKTAAAGYIPETRGVSVVRIISNAALALIIIILLASVITGGALTLISVLFLIMIVGGIAELGVRNVLKKKNYSEGKNKVITVVTGTAVVIILMFIALPSLIEQAQRSPEDIKLTENSSVPLSIEMLQPGCGEQWYEEEKKSTGVFADKTEDFYVKSYTEESLNAMRVEYGLSYEVYRIKVPFLYNKCLKSLTGAYPYNNQTEPINSSFWNADAAYIRVNNEYSSASGSHYIVCYKDSIVCLHSSWKLTAEQMKTAAEKLGTGE